MAEQWLRIDDALADGGGDIAAGDKGPGEFEQGRNDDCLLDADCAGADRRPHGIGNSYNFV